MNGASNATTSFTERSIARFGTLKPGQITRGLSVSRQFGTREALMNGDHTAGDLAQANEILESIVSNMADAVIVAGRDEKFLIFNPAAQRMFGEGATDITLTDWSHRHGL